MNSPEWWSWELEFSEHLCERMVDRAFTEVELRMMLEEERAIRPGTEEGRWVVTTKHEDMHWSVVIEPDEVDRALVVITAFPVE